MPIIDDRTTNLDLALPSQGNKLEDDVLRIRSAFTALDAVIPTKADLVAGKVPAGQLPSFVDDVLESANLAAFPVTGEGGKIYVDLTTNKTYRWGGSSYTIITASPGTSDEVPEGSANLYFTDARARAAQVPATAITPGLVKVGSGLSVTAEGLIALDVNTSFTESLLTITSDGQTAFVVDGGYAALSVQVLLNGVELLRNDDYVATDGINLTLAQGVVTGDKLLLRSWQAFLNMGPVSIPSAPVNTAPAGGSTITNLTTTFSGGAFIAPDGATHAATQVQFSTSAAFGSIVLDSGALAAATSAEVNLASLSLATTYYWRMRYQSSGGQWSTWSTPTTFAMPAALPSYIPTPTATPAAFGDALEGGFYAGLIWNELVQSSTSNAISLGSKSFTVPSMTAAPIVYDGQQLEIRSRANPTNKMTGVVTFAGGTTLTINVTSVGGAGTFTDWSIMSRYRVILAPKASGYTTGVNVTAHLGSTPSADANTPSEGFLATVALATAGSVAATWARGRNIAGYTDWYLPAQDELALVIRNLKFSGGGANSATVRPTGVLGPRGAYANTGGEISGIIKNSDPAYPDNNATETGNALFFNGAESIAIGDLASYVSSSYLSGTATVLYLTQRAQNTAGGYGNQSSSSMTSSSQSWAHFRAVRRSII